MTSDRDLSRGWFQDPHHHLDGRSLSGSIDAKETKDLTFANRQREFVDRSKGAIFFADFIDFNHASALAPENYISPVKDMMSPGLTSTHGRQVQSMRSPRILPQGSAL